MRKDDFMAEFYKISHNCVGEKGNCYSVSLELRLSFCTSWYVTAPPATVLLHKAEA